jgi:chitodextrinase
MKMRIALPAAAAALALIVIARHGAEAGVDAVSAASLTVTTSRITANSVSIDYSRDKYDYGTRTLYLDKSPVAPTTKIETKNASGNSGSFTVSNLQPNTQYNYKIEAIDTKGHERPYNTTGTFKTLNSTALFPAIPGAPGAVSGADRYDAAGRRLGAKKAAGGEGIIFTNRMAKPEFK